MVSLRSIAARIKVLKGLSTDVSVADLLGMKRNTFSQRMYRNSIPVEDLLTFCQTERIDVRWLFFGEGAPFPGEAAEDLTMYADEDIKAVAEMMMEMSPEGRRDARRHIEKEKLFEKLLKEKEASSDR